MQKSLESCPLDEHVLKAFAVIKLMTSHLIGIFRSLKSFLKKKNYTRSSEAALKMIWKLRRFFLKVIQRSFSVIFSLNDGWEEVKSNEKNFIFLNVVET